MPEELDPTSVIDPPDLEGAPAPEPEPEVEPIVAPTGFDPAAMATAFASALKEAGVGPQQHQQEQKQLSPEEAKKLLNVWDPDDAFIQKFGNLDTQKAAIAEMRDFFIKQADTVTQLRMQEFQQQMQQQFAPVQQFVSEQQAAARETKFNGTYPELAKSELTPLRDAVINGLATSGALKGKTDADAFKAIAGAMEAVIKQANPTFKLSAGSIPATKTKTTNGNALKPTTGGSGGGGGGKAVDTSGKPRALAFL